MAEQRYYLRARGRVTGPFDLAELQALRDRGQLGQFVELSVDQVTWRAVASWGLFGQIPGTARRGNILSQPSAVAGALPNHPSLFEKATLCPQQPASASAGTPSPQQPATAQVVEVAEWFYLVGDTPQGPTFLSDLRDSSLLRAETLVWRAGMSDWQPAALVPELTAWPTTVAPTPLGVANPRVANPFVPQSAPADYTGLAGQNLAGGRYRVLQLLDVGGMGAVYRAQDNNLQTDVAVKVPRLKGPRDEGLLKRFRFEAVSLVNLTHPHVVKILDAGDHQGLPFLVMQFLSGGNLKNRLEAGQVGPAAVRSLREWLPGVASALDYLHRRGYAHRDVKPANVLFDNDSNAFLADFGILKCLSPQPGNPTAMTLTGYSAPGTPAYLAPELIRNEPADGRSDQYALALTIYEALTGVCPFGGLSLPDISRRQKAGEPLPRKRSHPAIPAKMAKVVARGLALEPADRFDSCEAFVSAVLSGH